MAILFIWSCLSFRLTDSFGHMEKISQFNISSEKVGNYRTELNEIAKARTLIAHLPWLSRTNFLVLRNCFNRNLSSMAIRIHVRTYFFMVK